MDMDSIFKKVKSVAADVVDGAEKVTKNVVKTSGNLVDQTKLKFAMNEIEQKINEVYIEIGKYVYDQHKDGAEFTDIVGENCTKLDDLNTDLNELKQQLAESKNSVICNDCSTMNPSDSQFCSKCGSKLQ